MFATKTKDSPLQAEVQRLQKRLNETQAQMRDMQMILDLADDPEYILQRLRNLFPGGVGADGGRASQQSVGSQNPRVSATPVVRRITGQQSVTRMQTEDH